MQFATTPSFREGNVINEYKITLFYFWGGGEGGDPEKALGSPAKYMYELISKIHTYHICIFNTVIRL